MDNNLQRIPTVNIITEMANLEKDIDIAIMRYEYLRQEIIRRFPQLQNEPGFDDKYKAKAL